ncbi:hypothetical protein NMY22_g13607 [Coprinellus aureogranulatus]|nr:hypothetical protein NMY22_g13607 [Coprinellus aureogranulatus]
MRCVVPTLAYHLAKHEALHEFKAQLLISLDRHPDIFHKCLQEQGKCLILEPLRMIGDNCDRAIWPAGIVLDGLDEVLGEQARDPIELQAVHQAHDGARIEVLYLLRFLVDDPCFPFRIFVASRPETVISNFFLTPAQQRVTTQLFLGSTYNPDSDIERFLIAKFAGIRQQYGIFDSSWPGKRTVDEIVQISSGQFILPATIVRYVSAGPPHLRLDQVMSLGKGTRTDQGPFAVLDALYSQIFSCSPDPVLAAKWIGVIQDYSGSGTTAHFWRQFLEDSEGELSYLLGPLTSLMSIPSPNDTTSHFTFHHKSLEDFLRSESRSGQLKVFVSVTDRLAFAGDRCVSVLKNKGPKVKCRSQIDLDRFLVRFLRLPNLICRGPSPLDYRLSEHLGPFLDALLEYSKSELASCDVAWWTQLLLTGVNPAAGGVPNDHLKRPFWLGAFYCKIHSVICRERPHCLPACLYWRKGILAKARSLGWCVHELEQVGVNRQATRSAAELGTTCVETGTDLHVLSHMHAEEFAKKFRKPRSESACGQCQPGELRSKALSRTKTQRRPRQGREDKCLYSTALIIRQRATSTPLEGGTTHWDVPQLAKDQKDAGDQFRYGESNPELPPLSLRPHWTSPCSTQFPLPPTTTMTHRTQPFLLNTALYALGALTYKCYQDARQRSQAQCERELCRELSTHVRLCVLEIHDSRWMDNWVSAAHENPRTHPSHEQAIMSVKEIQLGGEEGGKISGVSVYSDRAEISREHRLSCRRGPEQVIILGLPYTLDESSARMEGKGEDTIHDVTISRTTADPAPLITSP